MSDSTILVKQGVVFRQFNAFTLEFLNALLSMAQRFNRSYVITSANDGHHGAQSYHARDCAWDIRLHDIEKSHRWVMRDVLDRELPPYFDVVLEEFDDNPGNDHLHVEADLNKFADQFEFEHSEA